MEPSQWRSTNRVHTFRHRTTERNYQPGRHILDHGKSNRRDQRQCLGAANGASANHIILDRVWLHGTTHDDTASAFNLNRMSYAALVDSYTTDFHCTASTGSCTDAHVVAGAPVLHPIPSIESLETFLKLPAKISCTVAAVLQRRRLILRFVTITFSSR